MASRIYKAKYLPTAQQDMVNIVRYISHELQNPTAANKLAEEFIEATENLLVFPYTNATYFPIKPLKKEYRKLLVQNYVIFYWIDEKNKVVTIARIIYAKRNSEKLLAD